MVRDDPGGTALVKILHISDLHYKAKKQKAKSNCLIY